MNKIVHHKKRKFPVTLTFCMGKDAVDQLSDKKFSVISLSGFFTYLFPDLSGQNAHFFGYAY